MHCKCSTRLVWIFCEKPSLFEDLSGFGFLHMTHNHHQHHLPSSLDTIYACTQTGAYHLRKLKRTCSQPSSSRYSSIWDNEGSAHNRITQQYRLPEGRVSRKIEGKRWQNSRTFALSVNCKSATALNFSLSRFSPSTPDPQGRRKASQNTNQR